MSIPAWLLGGPSDTFFLSLMVGTLTQREMVVTYDGHLSAGDRRVMTGGGRWTVDGGLRWAVDGGRWTVDVRR